MHRRAGPLRITPSECGSGTAIVASDHAGYDRRGHHAKLGEQGAYRADVGGGCTGPAGAAVGERVQRGQDDESGGGCAGPAGAAVGFNAAKTMSVVNQWIENYGREADESAGA